MRGCEGQVWREGSGTQDGEKESAEVSRGGRLTPGGDRGSGSRPQRGDRV